MEKVASNGVELKLAQDDFSILGFLTGDVEMDNSVFPRLGAENPLDILWVED